MSAIEQPALRSGRITCWCGPVRMSADSAMKCTPQKTTNSASCCSAAKRDSPNESPAHVGEVDDLLTLVVVAEDDEALAEVCAGRGGRGGPVRRPTPSV